ncbi:cupredoxin domain-containing protein [Paracandidimonas soli]|uniref:Putative cupredoxin-like copper-binding protein n=1 Tax=Paracandidimonas soli TaxID=1917182 RepID=A0A4R3VFL8_9BURK|nr:cupredoxin family protein [Paracandidimonas soli]TCV02803.1 putative cupredoxin-like copper-binding protein [Paracandidimonas soli]
MKLNSGFLALASAGAIALGVPGMPWAHADHAHHAHGAGALPEAHAAGQPGDAAKVTRTIEIGMQDVMRFTPASIQVAQGETVRFIVHNEGVIEHELVLGKMADLLAHAEQMRQDPGMPHDEPNAISLEAGEKGELIWQFGEMGVVDFACLLPGHSEAGMVGQITVR